MRSTARSRAAAAPGRRSAHRPRHRGRTPSSRTTRHAPDAAGTRSATIASNVAIARDETQLVLEAELPGRVGDQVADPGHRPAPDAHGTGSAGCGDGRASRPRSRRDERRASAPALTSHAVAIARSAGSRSSRVVVVTKAWGSSAIRRTRCARRSGSSSREDVVEQEQRRPAVERGQEVELGQLERQDRRPLLPARRERRRGRGRRARTPGRRGAGRRASSRSRPPSRRSPRAGGPARRAASRRGAAARSSRTAARAAPPRPPRGRSRRGRPPAARRGPPRSRRRSATIVAAGIEEGRVPEPQLVARRLLLADRPQQAVALLERPAVGREVHRRRPASRARRAGRAPRAAATASPATSSISSGANTTTRRTPAEARRPAADAVDPDPLPAAPVAAGAGADDRDLDRRRGPTTPSTRASVGRPSGSARRRPRVRWERPQASSTIASRRLVLPAAFGPQTSCGPGPKRLERGVAPQVERVEMAIEQAVGSRRTRSLSGGGVRIAGRQDVVRTGMTTWT